MNGGWGLLYNDWGCGLHDRRCGLYDSLSRYALIADSGYRRGLYNGLAEAIRRHGGCDGGNANGTADVDGYVRGGCGECVQSGDVTSSTGVCVLHGKAYQTTYGHDCGEGCDFLQTEHGFSPVRCAR